MANSDGFAMLEVRNFKNNKKYLVPSYAVLYENPDGSMVQLTFIEFSRLINEERLSFVTHPDYTNKVYTSDKHIKGTAATEIREQEETVAKPTSALDTQVGGAHYKGRGIQPIEYIHANNLNFSEGSIVKYITRWRDKGGIKDLEKIKHYVDLLIEMETKYGSLKKETKDEAVKELKPGEWVAVSQP